MRLATRQAIATLRATLHRRKVSKNSASRIVAMNCRKEQVAIAGNATPESIEAEIHAAKAANSKLWNASFSCDPAWTSRDATRAFCATLAELEKKRAAAVRRDQIDADLAKLDAQDVEAPPSAVDSYVANMGRFIGLLGYTVDDKANELIPASRDWLKGVGVELLAAFGPAALLSLLARSAHQPNQAPQPQPQPQRKPKKAAKAIVAPIVNRRRNQRKRLCNRRNVAKRRFHNGCLCRSPPRNRSRRVHNRRGALQRLAGGLRRAWH
jgi:hypothetical protein